MIYLLILRLWNYFKGYVIIKIEGLALEKFINMCIVRDIYLWDIKRINYTILEAKIDIKNFKTACKIARRAGCKIYISQKNGYPFWFSKIKKRKMLIFGAFFSLIFLVVLSSFILNIEVVGNERVETQKIIEALDQSGLSIGMNRYFIDLREIENNLLINMQDLAWVGIEIGGINAKIEVVEKVIPPLQIEKNIPCDVVAKKSGVIEKVIARRGDSLVDKGDIVAPGDILITGIIEAEDMEETWYLHAYGEVYARTYYEGQKSIDLTKWTKKKTGNKIINRNIKLGNIEITLNKGENPYNVYIVERNSKRFIKWRNKELPVEVITEEIYEAVEIKESLDTKKAKERLHTALIEEILEKIPKNLEILNSTTDFVVKNNKLQCDVIIEVLEEIGEQKKIQYGED